MTAAEVSRLLGRMAFGATAADLDAWTGKPYEQLVEHLVATSVHPVPATLPDDPRRLYLEREPNARHSDPRPARRWWLERMRTTPFPLLERMTLFWHGHFATALSGPPFMNEILQQNQRIREHALGNFRTLAGAMTVDPAMLYYLSGYLNTVPNPNENYAREFFELFTLGKRPQVYTERDIREAARAFTGWTVDTTTTPVFHEGRHDKGSKRVLGQVVSNLRDKEYLKLVDIALAQPVSYRFIAWKLVANFVYVPQSRDLLKTPGPLVQKVATALKKDDWDIAAAVRTMLLADEFRYVDSRFGPQNVRTPVECVVHAAKAFGVPADADALLTALDMMGHSLYNPVNVGGWPLGKDWLTPTTAIARYDAAIAIFGLTSVGAEARLPAPDDLPAWAKRLGLAGFGLNTTKAVENYLRRTASAGVAERQAGVLALLLSSPEWVVM